VLERQQAENRLHQEEQAMNRFRALAIFTAVAVLPASAADTPFDANAAAKLVAPFLDEQAFGVARLDLSAVDIDEWADKITKWTGMPAKDLAEARKGMRDMHAQLRKAGASEVYAVLSLADFPMPGPFVLVTSGAGADTASIARVLEGLNMESTWVKDGVVAAGPKKSIERLKSLTPSPRPDLATALGAIPGASAQLVITPSADQRRVLEESAPKLPADLGGGPGTVVTRGAKWVAIGVLTKPKFSVQLIVQSPDAASAQALQTVATKAIEFAAKAGKEMQLDLNPLVPILAPKVAGDRLTVSLREDDEAVGKLITSAARRTRSAAGRTKSMNNIKQLALALHNYHDANGTFPPTGSQDKDGKPLLSWRVLILPYLEQDNLYKQFKLDEPWDSETNKALIAKMPDVFKSPAQNAGDGKTTYLAPMAKDTVIAPGKKGAKISDITDGTSNTIMIVETNDDAGVIWTKPDDLDVSANAQEILKKLIGHYPEGFIAGFADGSVRFIRLTIDPVMLKALFTRNGGEVIRNIP
jgi:Protein of unknown function (DUF1559)